MMLESHVFQVVQVEIYNSLINNFFGAIVESSDDAIICKTLDGVVASWNKGAENIFGYRADEMIGRSISRVFPEYRLHEEEMILARIRMGCKVDHFKTTRLHKDGHEIHLSVTVSPVRDSLGNVIGASKIARDITLTEEAVRLSEKFAAIVESSNDAIISKTPEGIVTSWNKGAESVFGFRPEEMIGQPIARLFPAGRFYEEDMILEKIARGERVEHFKTTRLHKNGHEVHVSVTISAIRDLQGRIIGASKIARDISDQVLYEKMLLKHARFDALTGLPNRCYFMQLLEQQLQVCQIHNENCALLYLDLDKFKDINDQFGHEFGDQVLKFVSSSLQGLLRKVDTSCRLGGDEFLVLLPAMDDLHEIEKVARNIIRILNKGLSYKNRSVGIDASIGISVYPRHATTEDQLIRAADSALYEVKRSGKNNLNVFHEEVSQTLEKNRQLRVDMPRAIELNQFELLFQPIIEMQTGRIRKAEALIRWHHPDFGTLSANEFIHLAEETEIIHQLGNWVFEEALNRLVAWRGLLGPDFQLSINKSPIQFLEDDGSSVLWPEKLKKVGLSPANLMVEITESSLMNQTQVTQNKLLSYHHAGIQVAIDDFGTGYSCLAYLNQFDIDYIKIDKSFVTDICRSTNAYNLCEAIIAMAHKLKLLVVAEGVETEQQRQALVDMGCDYSQGYLYSRPLTEKEFLAFIKG